MFTKLILSCLLLASAGQVFGQEISSTGCNGVKGCYRSPVNCTSSSTCDFMVTYQTDATANTVTFEVSAKATKWIALGVNKATTMDGTKGEMCINALTGPVMKGFQNKGYNQPSLYPKAATVTFGSLTSVNGALICRFTRSVLPNATYQVTMNGDYHLVVAAGDTLTATDGPQYHSVKVASTQKFDTVAFVAPVPTTAGTPAATSSNNATISNATTTAATSGNTTTGNATTTKPSPVTTNASNSTVSNMTTSMPSAEPSTGLHSNLTTMMPSAEPTTKPAGKDGAGMIASTTVVVVACAVLAQLSSH